VSIKHSFSELFNQYSWDEVCEKIYASTDDDVVRAINKNGKLSPDDFIALISTAAKNHLPEMINKSFALTRKRFGNVMQMYIPMYLSNECNNVCTNCGFSFGNKLPRITLSDEEILNEVAVIKAMGYEHILLVTGEDNQKVGVDYIAHAIEIIRPHFAHISLEVQPMEKDEYEKLIPFGLNTVLVYQETYHEANYKTYHPKGKKSNFNFRLETADRLGEAGIHKIGLGVLLGLEDWRADSFFTALHLNYLNKKYWQTKYSISFPRLRPAEGAFEPKHPMSEKDLLQLICAFRIFDENVELSLSTRESPAFRDKIFELGITSMSAGSKTDPGGYASDKHALEQFHISDERTPAEVAEVIRSKGYEVVWKDWDAVLQ
jgi:2-iminoacetate synthase